MSRRSDQLRALARLARMRADLELRRYAAYRAQADEMRRHVDTRVPTCRHSWGDCAIMRVERAGLTEPAAPAEPSDRAVGAQVMRREPQPVHRESREGGRRIVMRSRRPRSSAA